MAEDRRQREPSSNGSRVHGVGNPAPAREARAYRRRQGTEAHGKMLGRRPVGLLQYIVALRFGTRRYLESATLSTAR